MQSSVGSLHAAPSASSTSCPERVFGSAPGNLVLLPPPDALHQHGVRLLQAALAGLEEAEQGGIHIPVDHQARRQHTPRRAGVQLQQLLELAEQGVAVRHGWWRCGARRGSSW